MSIFVVLAIIQIFLLIYQLMGFRNLRSSLSKAQKKTHCKREKTEALLHSIYLLLEHPKKLPPSLIDIPFTDGLVREVEIPAIRAPYNASIGLSEKGYLLFFRYDTPSPQNSPFAFFSHIGSIHLDRAFSPLEETFIKLETGSLFSEDARFFQCNGQSFLIYTDQNSSNKRGIHVGLLDEEKRKFLSITPLPVKKIEKNWTPFSQQGQFHFLHTIYPPKVLSLPNPQKTVLHSLPVPSCPPLEWVAKWGELRGGTAAIPIDGEYLSIFHSSFQDHKGIIWYVMGAYMFKATPPFRLTKISPYPILFKGIYDTPHQIMANPKIRSLYPVGLLHENDLLHISCGENDSSIKILSLNKKTFLESLRSC